MQMSRAGNNLVGNIYVNFDDADRCWQFFRKVVKEWSQLLQLY